MTDENNDPSPGHNYTLTNLSIEHMSALLSATDCYSRLQMGQLQELERCLPLQSPTKINWSEFHEDIKIVKQLLSKHMTVDASGGQYLGVFHQDLEPEAKSSWDIYQVIRHRLSWDSAYEQGLVEPGQPRTSKMMQVFYDTPMQTGNKPIPKAFKETE